VTTDVTTADLRGLGSIQRAALECLCDAPKGLTAPELAHLSWGSNRVNRSSATLHALKLLRDRGLVVTTGREPRPLSEGRGGWAYRWMVTDRGRELFTGSAQNGETNT
jgi:hypothetical protein